MADDACFSTLNGKKKCWWLDCSQQPAKALNSDSHTYTHPSNTSALDRHPGKTAIKMNK